MHRLRKTVEIAAPPDAVWEVLGDLPKTNEWLPGTTSARMESSMRVCTMADGSEVREEISEYSPERRSYSFRHVQIPLPVEHSTGTFTVEASNGGSIVVLESEFEADDDIARGFDDALGSSLESLRRRVEEGTPWDVT